MDKTSKIYVAGHRGLVGSALVRALKAQGYSNLILKTRHELNLLDHGAIRSFFQREKPDYVFLAAAKVGSIVDNGSYPADFIYENLTIQNHIIHNAHLTKVKKLLFLGSSCVYPRMAPQPIREDHLLSGPLEETNIAYATAKIAGIIACQAYNRQHGTNFVSVIPTNLYGPNDNFNLSTSHVLPALLRRFHEAKAKNVPQVEVWGTGSAKREFLHVDDLADACLFLMKNYNDNKIVNIGTGEDISIKEAAEAIMETVGYEGKIFWDTSKPEGTPRKLLDVSKINDLGWKHKIDFRAGLKSYYEWYLANKA